VAPFRMPVRSELGLVPLDAGQLDSRERALACRDVIRMAVAAIGSPDDRDLGSHPPQPAHDIAHDPLLFDIGEAAVGVLEAGDARQAHAQSCLRELLRAGRTDERARNDVVVDTGPALLTLREAKAVHFDPLLRISDE